MITLAYIFKGIALILSLVAFFGLGVLLWREIRRAPEGREGRDGWTPAPRASGHFTRHRRLP